MTTTAYLRVSTGTQDLANQKLAILEYARRKKFPIIRPAVQQEYPLSKSRCGLCVD